jgi:hypothetical protein
VQRSRVRIFHNERTGPPHWTPNSCFGAFRTISLLHELGCKMGRTGAVKTQVHAMKSCWNFPQPTSRAHVGYFRNKRTRSTPLDPKLMSSCISDRFIIARISVQNGQTGAINAQVRATKSYQNFSQQTHPIHPNGLQTYVLGRFGPFSLLPVLQCKMGQIGALNAQVRTTKSHKNFSQRTHPIHPIGPQTHILGYFGTLHYCMNFGAKRAELVQLVHKFVQ